MEAAPVFIGIDVSKAQLDVAERPSGERAVMAPTCLVLEATGGLEVPLASALAVAGMPVAVVNPRQVRDFARATGQLAKTDAIDAQTLARFAEAVRPAPRPLPDDAMQAFSALLTRRRQLIEMLVAEQNRMQRAPHPIQQQIQAHVTWLKQQLAALAQPGFGGGPGPVDGAGLLVAARAGDRERDRLGASSDRGAHEAARAW